MKAYVYLLSIIVLFFSACRVSSALSSVQASEQKTLSATKTTGEHNTTIAETAVVDAHAVEDILSSEQALSVSSSEANSSAYQEVETNINYFDENGNLRATVNQTKRSGRTDQTNERNGSLHASNQHRSSEQSTNMESKREINSNSVTTKNELNESEVNTLNTLNKESNADNRIIQGVEWLYVAGAIILIVGLFLLIKTWKKRA